MSLSPKGQRADSRPLQELSGQPLRSRSSYDSDDSLRALELLEGAAPPTLHRGRSVSMSSLSFERDLLPLTASLSEPDEVKGAVAEKSIGLVNGVALVVGLQIGSGIFSSPGVVVSNTGSVGASLIVWLLSGLLGWTGASSFAELGSAIPLNGGAQAYLAYSYGPIVSYLFAWTAISALKPGSNAVISLIFAEYLNRLFWHATRSDVSPDDIPQWAIQVTAIAAVSVITFVCVVTRSLGTRVAVVFTTVKVCGTRMSITVLGMVQLARGRATTSFTTSVFDGTTTSPSAYALALYSGLWAFDGWDQANYVGGEMSEPEKNIPRVIHFSMMTVTLLFLLANVSYFVVLDKATVGLSNTVALDFGRALFGPIGGSVFAFMVAFSCLGALNGSFFTTGRLIYVAGREGYLPALFGRLHPTRHTPLNAMLLQAGITITFILLGGGFRSLINFAVVASWAFYFLTVLGLVILRIKEPMLERPYKTWITTPLLFCAVALFLLYMPIIAAPLEALAVLGFVLAGIPMYYITQRGALMALQRKLPSLSPLLSRFQDQSTRTPGFGWQAVATEGDDDIEMTEDT
ncbi:amino acid permease-domain-containing protein [Lactarius akahatsu]|uniref:Amino acid permease-domain-containing protein n=1 Tax=Lactarius akahatsu TaxID=416441 RepID=A0AAD4LSR7_9AGAM|nr:amino acid permease-domain-containing protein [Lactarius akahatsu]